MPSKKKTEKKTTTAGSPMLCSKGRPITAERFNNLLANAQIVVGCLHSLVRSKTIAPAIAAQELLNTTTGELSPLVNEVEKAYNAFGYSFDKELYMATHGGPAAGRSKAVAALKAERVKRSGSVKAQ